MVLVPPASPVFNRYWERLGNLGCSYESKSHRTSLGDRILYSIDVPAQSDVRAVYSILEEGERNGIWMFQEGHVGHKLKS